MIKSIRICKLFNLFDYNINLDNRIVILTGPNGYGKTTILRILNALAELNLLYIIETPFEKIEVTTDSDKIEFEKRNSQFIFRCKDKQDLIFKFGEKDSETLRLKEEYDRGIDLALDSVNYKISPDFKKALITLASFDKPLEQSLLIRKFIDLYFYLEKSKLKIQFIKEQRLLKEIQKEELNIKYEGNEDPETLFIEVIEKYAKNLKKFISKVESEYTNISHDLDSSFPKRLFIEEKGVNKEEFEERYQQIKEIQKGLMRYGLLESKEDDSPIYKEENGKVLKIYLDDTEKKLSVFQTPLKQLDIFTDILNNKRFSHKKIVVDKKHGFRFVCDDGQNLELRHLSSGEKHELVLLFELLFNTEKDTQVLIDEPEISLHVAWQKEFLNDIKRIADLKEINVLVATHSPQIINDKWDLVTDLEEISNEKTSF